MPVFRRPMLPEPVDKNEPRLPQEDVRDVQEIDGTTGSLTMVGFPVLYYASTPSQVSGDKHW